MRHRLRRPERPRLGAVPRVPPREPDVLVVVDVRDQQGGAECRHGRARRDALVGADVAGAGVEHHEPGPHRVGGRADADDVRRVGVLHDDAHDQALGRLGVGGVRHLARGVRLGARPRRAERRAPPLGAVGEVERRERQSPRLGQHGDDTVVDAPRQTRGRGGDAPGHLDPVDRRHDARCIREGGQACRTPGVGAEVETRDGQRGEDGGRQDPTCPAPARRGEDVPPRRARAVRSCSAGVAGCSTTSSTSSTSRICGRRATLPTLAAPPDTGAAGVAQAVADCSTDPRPGQRSASRPVAGSGVGTCRRLRSAHSAADVRSVTPMRVKMLPTCALTVPSVIYSCRAICLLARPHATRASTSRSRAVRSSPRTRRSRAQHGPHGAGVQRRLAPRDGAHAVAQRLPARRP